MNTEVFGTSYDTIQFSGKLQMAVKNLPANEPVIILFSDDTVLRMERGRPGHPYNVWTVAPIRKGNLFIHISHYSNNQVDSDIAVFDDGLLCANIFTRTNIVSGRKAR